MMESIAIDGINARPADAKQWAHRRAMRLACAFVPTAIALCAGSVAHAQAFPGRVVRIIVPTTPGGSLDLVARLVARKLGEAWAQNVVVDNRAGAGGVIGADLVAKAAPDGYAIGFIASQFTVSAGVYRKLPYDSVRDFAPVTQLVAVTWVLVVNSSLPVRSVKELIALAKKMPGQINYASTGSGGATHLAVELLNSMAGIRMTHIPYKGTVPAVNDVVGGQAALIITGLAGMMPQITAGRLRVLGTVDGTRSRLMPDLPTVGETVPGYEYNNWFGVLAPRATPDPIVAQLHDQIARALQADEVKSPLLAQGMEPRDTSPAQFGEMIRQEVAKYSALAKQIGVNVD